MSIRRAIEANFKWTLDPHFQNGTHQVVESLRTEDRPFPAIIIVAGQAASAIPEQPDCLGNYKIPVSVIVLSSYDETSVNAHTSIVYEITNIYRNIQNRRKSRVKGLYIYDILPGVVGEAHEGRKLSSVINFDAMVNYAPVAQEPEPV